MTSQDSPALFTILYFATAYSFTQKASERLPAPMPAACLFDELDKKYPGIKQRVLKSCAVTINLDYVDVDPASEAGSEAGTTIIQEGDEVAIIPPVSSG